MNGGFKSLMKHGLGSMTLAVAVSACAMGNHIPEADTPEGQLFQTKCTVCHSWPHPGRHSPREWDHYLTIMESHMKSRGIPFSTEEKKMIQSYLHRNARK